jgi:colanic acid biosynthesis glycosyl transferase WcaI
MKILYICQYFPPEVCAPAVRAFELSREWARAGNEVMVLTGFPNHPEGKLHPEYRPAWRRGIYRENYEGIRVYRTWLYPAANQGIWRRSANYISFAVTATLSAPWIAAEPEVVMATSPQLLVGAAGYAIARWLGVPFIFEARDLWPESLEAVDVASRRSLLYRSLEQLARFLYCHADRTIVDGEWKRKALTTAGIPAKNIVVIRNGVAIESFAAPQSAAARKASEQWRKKMGLKGKFVVMYCGNFGMAQRLETVLEAAAELRDVQEVAFVFAGEGPERGKFDRTLAELRLNNVRYVGKQPHNSIPALLAAADACLIPLRPSTVFQTAIPSKLFEAMAAAKPVILGVDGEAKELVLESHAGIAVPPGDAAALARAVIKLQRDPLLAQTLGAHGRRVAQSKYQRGQQAAAYLNVFAEIMQRQRTHEPASVPAPVVARWT